MAQTDLPTLYSRVVAARPELAVTHGQGRVIYVRAYNGDDEHEDSPAQLGWVHPTRDGGEVFWCGEVDFDPHVTVKWLVALPFRYSVTKNQLGQWSIAAYGVDARKHDWYDSLLEALAEFHAPGSTA